MASVDPLLEPLRRGEAAAFEAAYALHHTRIYTFLLRLCRRRDVADDLFQETFTKLAVFAKNLREDTDLAAWLFTVARNAYRSHRRWALLDLSRLLPHSHSIDVASAAQTPEADAELRQRQANMAQALARLPYPEREALLLVAVEGFEQERAAVIVGISYAAFRQRLHRARIKLAEALTHLERP